MGTAHPTLLYLIHSARPLPVGGCRNRHRSSPFDPLSPFNLHTRRGSRNSLFKPQRTQRAQRKESANSLRSLCALWFNLLNPALDATVLATPYGRGVFLVLFLLCSAVFLKNPARSMLSVVQSIRPEIPFPRIAWARNRPIRVLASVMVPSRHQSRTCPKGSQWISMTSWSSWSWAPCPKSVAR